MDCCKGHVLTAWCSCMAGSGQCCNHVIATLYKVEYANSHDFISPSCTSMPCGWNKSTKTATEPKRIADIIVRKRICTKMQPGDADERAREDLRSKELSQFDPRQPMHQNMTGDRLSKLLQTIHFVSPNAVLFKSVESMTKPSSEKLTITVSANEIMKDKNLNTDDEKVSSFLAKLSFSEANANMVERLTRNQSKCKMWLEHRKGRLTASKHHEFYTKINTISRVRNKIYPKTTPLVKQVIYKDDNLDKVAAVQ